MVAKKKLDPRTQLMFARALFAQGFKELKTLPKKGFEDFEQSLHENIYGTSDLDLERDLLSTLDSWIKDSDDASWYGCFDDGMTPEEAVAKFKEHPHQWMRAASGGFSFCKCRRAQR